MVYETCVPDIEEFQLFVYKISQGAARSSDPDLVSRTTDAIFGWQVRSVLPADLQQLAWPSPEEDNEITVDRPILQSILCRLNEILDCENTDILTTELTNCDLDPQSHDRPDFTMRKPCGYTSAEFPLVGDNIVEVKCFRSDAKKLKKYLEKGRRQGMGHLAKRLLHSLDFFGMGADSEAIALCITPCSIEVIRLALTGVGTENVDLAVVGTGCRSLFGKANCPFDGQIPKDQILADSAGFVLLAGALLYSPDDECAKRQIQVHDSGSNTPITKKCKYLGSGGFRMFCDYRNMSI